jgi:hypothetical protein
MRIVKEFGVRTQASAKAKRKFFLVFEGEKTEVQYFTGVNAHKTELGISALIEIKLLMRSTGHEGTSNPKRIIQLLIKHMTETIDNGITCGLLIEKICDYLFYELDISETSMINPKSVTEGLGKVSKKRFGLEPHSVVTDINAVLDEYELYLKKKYNIENSAETISEYIKSSEVVFDKDYDRVCIVVDRDRQSFTADQYDYVLEQCRRHGFDLFVSNPCFEFWLLLHFPGAGRIDRKAVLRNRRTSSRKNYVEALLSNHMNGYRKNAVNFSILKDRVNLAVEQEKLFCEDIEGLKTKLGTNVGRLITLMQKS